MVYFFFYWLKFISVCSCLLNLNIIHLEIHLPLRGQAGLVISKETSSFVSFRFAKGLIKNHLFKMFTSLFQKKTLRRRCWGWEIKNPLNILTNR